MPTAKRRFRHAKDRIENLATNPGYQFASKHALSIYQSDAVYSFIPKNACSTMRYTLAIANGMIDGPEHYAWIHYNNLTFRASQQELAKANYTFVILRDPFLRVASCYLDKMVSHTAIAAEFPILAGLQIRPDMLTFREFVGGLKTRLRTNEHWRPQVDFLIYEDYDDIFCLEAFPEVVRALQDRLGLAVHDARHLTRHGTDQFAFLDNDDLYADTPAHEIASLKRGGKIPRPEQLYDQELITQVRLLYADDLAFYDKAIGRRCIFSNTAQNAPKTHAMAGAPA